MPDRIHAMDAKQNVLVVGLANEQIHSFDVRKASEPVNSTSTPLKMQITALAIFNDLNGYTTGCIGGRCHITYYSAAREKDSFSFRCHRSTTTSPKQPQYAYAVTSVHYHPELGNAFATTGSDGAFTFWVSLVVKLQIIGTYIFY
jgi:hypothetical protein